MSLRSLGVVIVLACVPRFAHAQCLDWHTFPAIGPDVSGDVLDLEVHDDGSGPALYLSGDLTLSSTGQHTAVARWNGTNFEIPGSLQDGIGRALARFDDGTGLALYAIVSGASLTAPSTLAKWDGVAWSTVGLMDGKATVMSVHDDGSGPALCVAGFFHNTGAVSTPGVAKWDGTSWSSLGAGPFGVGPVDDVSSIASVNEAAGPALYVGGDFFGQSGMPSYGLARWQNGAWSGVAGGIGHVFGLASWDNGTGPALYAAREDHSAIWSIVRWTGTQWQSVPNPGIKQPTELRVLEDGSTSRLYVGDRDLNYPYFSHVYALDSSGWSQIGPNPNSGCVPYNPSIHALALFPAGSGQQLFAGTSLKAVGTTLGYLSRYDGNQWVRVGAPLRGIDGTLSTMLVHDDGAGPALYIGGTDLCHADELGVWGIARWRGTGFESVGTGLRSSVTALGSCDFGTGALLIAGDADNGLATISKFNGAGWFTLGTTYYATDRILCMQQFGSQMYIGGGFPGVLPSLLSPNLVRWNPTTGFTSAGGVDGQVNALVTFDSGSGLELYAGGTFAQVGSAIAHHVARFDGTHWSPLGSGTNGLVDALVSFDDGSGNALYAAGTFSSAGGVLASHVAKWNGTSWSALGAGLNAQVLTLEVFDDGSGPALYAATSRRRAAFPWSASRAGTARAGRLSGATSTGRCGR